MTFIFFFFFKHKCPVSCRDKHPGDNDVFIKKKKDFLLFFEGRCLRCGRFGGWSCLNAAVKDFLFISRGFCFDVNNPNSILIFNSLKKKLHVLYTVEKTQLGTEVVYT